jgi:pseudouridine synthase
VILLIFLIISYIVGRLDKDSEGLMLLTNDGNLANQLTHPRYEHEKEYDVLLNRTLTKNK